MLTQVLERATLTGAGVARPTPRRAGALGEHGPELAGCSASCRAWPASTRRPRGDAPTTDADPRGPWPRPVTDPELPMLTLADLGVLRDVRIEATARSSSRSPRPTPAARRWASCAPTWCTPCTGPGSATSTCAPSLSPAWSTDWISEEGRRKLAAGGIAPPGRRRSARRPGAAAARPHPPDGACPLCGSADTEELSEFGATACKALRRCRSCREPFEHVKEI